GPVVANTVKQTLRQPDHAVGLRLATQEDWLESRRQERIGVDAVESLRVIDFLLSHDATVARRQSASSRRSTQKRVIAKSQITQTDLNWNRESRTAQKS